MKTTTPETDSAWENEHPLHRLSDQEKRELCEKIEGERDKALERCKRYAEREDSIRYLSSRNKEMEMAGNNLLAENRRLKLALARAARWGIRSDGFSAEVGGSLRLWIDGGMVGDPPEIPSYYPQNT